MSLFLNKINRNEIYFNFKVISIVLDNTTLFFLWNILCLDVLTIYNYLYEILYQYWKAWSAKDNFVLSNHNSIKLNNIIIVKFTVNILRIFVSKLIYICEFSYLFINVLKKKPSPRGHNVVDTALEVGKILNEP